MDLTQIIPPKELMPYADVALDKLIAAKAERYIESCEWTSDGLIVKQNESAPPALVSKLFPECLKYIEVREGVKGASIRLIFPIKK